MVNNIQIIKSHGNNFPIFKIFFAYSLKLKATTQYNSSDEPSYEVHEPMALYLALRSGYSTQHAINFITESFIHTVDKAAKIFGVSKRTIQDWGRTQKTLQSQYGDTLIELEEILRIGLIPFGQDKSA